MPSAKTTTRVQAQRLDEGEGEHQEHKVEARDNHEHNGNGNPASTCYDIMQWVRAQVHPQLTVDAATPIDGRCSWARR